MEARKIALALKEKTGMTFKAMAEDINARAGTKFTAQKASDWFSQVTEGAPPAVVKVYLTFMAEKHLK